MAHARTLSSLPTFDKSSKGLYAVIETPKGSHNKYTYPDYACFELSKTLPEGTAFPSTSALSRQHAAETATRLTLSFLWIFPP
jgi:hypothetical protein